MKVSYGYEIMLFACDCNSALFWETQTFSQLKKHFSPSLQINVYLTSTLFIYSLFFKYSFIYLLVFPELTLEVPAPNPHRFPPYTRFQPAKICHCRNFWLYLLRNYSLLVCSSAHIFNFFSIWLAYIGQVTSFWYSEHLKHLLTLKSKWKWVIS